MARVSALGFRTLAEVRRSFFLGYSNCTTGTTIEEPGRGSHVGTTLWTELAAIFWLLTFFFRLLVFQSFDVCGCTRKRPAGLCFKPFYIFLQFCPTRYPLEPNEHERG
jgi:hypothetical protein